MRRNKYLLDYFDEQIVDLESQAETVNFLEPSEVIPPQFVGSNQLLDDGQIRGRGGA